MKGKDTQKFLRTGICKVEKVLKILGKQLKLYSVLILETSRPNMRSFCALALFFLLGPALETVAEKIEEAKKQSEGLSQPP